MSKAWKCPACGEEWVGDEKDLKDLCPACMAEMREGCTEILLGKDDGAIVLRAEGEQEMFLPDYEDDDTIAPPTMIALTKLAIALGNKGVQDLIDEVMVEETRIFEKEEKENE